MTESHTATDNRRQQVQLYGEPLADILRSIGSTLGLTQAEIAEVLGLSAPMLSHLISARRVKIGNPVAGSRLAQLRTLAAQVATDGLAPEEVAAQLDAIADSGPTGTATGANTFGMTTATGRATTGRDVQQLFRTVAGALDWLEVADLAGERHPEIAEVLRVYGAGRSDAADLHWATMMDSRR